MHVGVLEAGDQHSALQVDDRRARPDQVARLVVAHGDDPSLVDRHGARAGSRGIRREHGATREDQIGEHPLRLAATRA